MPPGAFGFTKGDGLAIKGEGKAVSGVVPNGDLLSTKEELVFAKEDGNGLDPSEVPLHVVVAPADEVSVDVEVGVG